ncbi:mitochondrial ATPase complex subunit ATP10 isoform X1 [Dendrobium catenatum]|uniref:Mitochondrial ATPase complex subunit ATP10 n=1 Tax=Dendrobium catenatum TaxID=906689 RepID=A0A2I0XG63_9ASPA|nr:mitochondrial ATPase complex subunit ATP10 isoform X1 [Dendrobium catenatum]PKU86898.1 hypothetical protein MA16_Dca022138 [Dendrobium catenatum]
MTAKLLGRLLQLPTAASALLAPAKILPAAYTAVGSLHPDQHGRISFRRHFFDLHKMVDKEAIKREKDRLKDELSRGYFADFSEIHKNSGKIAPANKTLIASMAAAMFPDIVVYFSDGRRLKLPLSDQNVNNHSTEIIPSATLLCLSFRASSQRMAESWSAPFLETLDASTNVQVYEVSFIESWLLSLNPMKNLFLKIARSSSYPLRRIAYSFGDHYDLRKELQILNLLTGYIFLLDRHGRIRWQGFGFATTEEVSSLLSCATLLLEE